MPGVGRIGDKFDCGDYIAEGSPDVFINGIAVGRHGDATTGHGCFPANHIISTHQTVFVNGKPIALVGDKDEPHTCKTTHQGTLVGGSSDVSA
jgi:uncharacterized Zn-binding protein involved in type VI secretion